MSELYPVIFGLVFIAMLGFAVGLFLRLLNRPWWGHRWVRLTSYFIPAFGGICIMLWAMGVKSNIRLMTDIGAIGTAMILVTEMALLLSLPISGVFHGIHWIIRRLKKNMVNRSRTDLKRRLLLKSAAAVFPIVAVSTGVGGIASSFAKTRMPRLTFSFTGLPEALEGLTILQLSDSHLGYYVVLQDLEIVLVDAERYRLDMVLVTGDVADDLDLLPEALKLISQLKPPLGCYACLGNHEYYRGIDKVREYYDKSPIQLLVNEGITIDVEGVALYVAGADDPRWLRGDNSLFLSDTISRCLADAPDNAFKIVMSHRPEGFDFSAEKRVELTLAGHTHGGQIGIGGRSFFEQVLPYKYLWGHYTKGNGSQLYTTSGIGHWFPFRLGCPPEAPVVEVKRYIH